jgi:hypothetical protein
MNRITRLSAIALAGVSALLVAGCNDDNGGSSSAAKPAQSAAATAQPSSPAAAPSAGSAAPAQKSSAPAAAGGDNSITFSGGHGTYKFTEMNCLGAKDASGKLAMTATTADGNKANAIITFESGKASLLLTVSDSGGDAVWTGEAAIGSTASRTANAVKLAGLPVTKTSAAGMSDGITATGTLTCSDTAALL